MPFLLDFIVTKFRQLLTYIIYLDDMHSSITCTSLCQTIGYHQNPSKVKIPHPILKRSSYMGQALRNRKISCPIIENPVKMDSKQKIYASFCDFKSDRIFLDIINESTQDFNHQQYKRIQCQGQKKNQGLNENVKQSEQTQKYTQTIMYSENPLRRIKTACSQIGQTVRSQQNKYLIELLDLNSSLVNEMIEKEQQLDQSENKLYEIKNKYMRLLQMKGQKSESQLQSLIQDNRKRQQRIRKEDKQRCLRIKQKLSQIRIKEPKTKKSKVS